MSVYKVAEARQQQRMKPMRRIMRASSSAIQAVLKASDALREQHVRAD